MSSLCGLSVHVTGWGSRWEWMNTAHDLTHRLELFPGAGSIDKTYSAKWAPVCVPYCCYNDSMHVLLRKCSAAVHNCGVGCKLTNLPVCGHDRITYMNDCLAECGGAHIAHTGPCSSLSISQTADAAGQWFEDPVTATAATRNHPIAGELECGTMTLPKPEWRPVYTLLLVQHACNRKVLLRSKPDLPMSSTCANCRAVLC